MHINSTWVVKWALLLLLMACMHQPDGVCIATMILHVESTEEVTNVTANEGQSD